MWVFDWLLFTVEENPMSVSVFGISFAFTFVAALVGFCCRDRGFYLSFSVMITSVALIVFLAAEKPLAFVLACMLALCFLSAIFYAMLTCGLMIRAHILRRRKRRAEILRKVQYTLPDKDNSYIRTRLNTQLQPQTASFNKEEKEAGNKETFRPEYAGKLLQKVQEAPLTKAERMEMEEVARLFSAYLKKSRWTVEDVRLMNDMFSYLVKISAKYSV